MSESIDRIITRTGGECDRIEYVLGKVQKLRRKHCNDPCFGTETELTLELNELLQAATGVHACVMAVHRLVFEELKTDEPEN